MILPNQELLALEIHQSRQKQVEKSELVKSMLAQLPKQPGRLAKGLHWVGCQLESLGVKLQQKQHPSLANTATNQPPG